jgi:hypothetical protein
MKDDLSGSTPAIMAIFPQTGLALTNGQRRARLFFVPALIHDPREKSIYHKEHKGHKGK